jgi:hypothetical protein
MKWFFSTGYLKLDHVFNPVQISKWIKDLHISPNTLKLVQEREGNILEHIGIDNNFLNRTPVAQQLR